MRGYFFNFRKNSLTMRRYPFLIGFFFLFYVCNAQSVATPDKIYGELFTDVQMAKIFPDSKTFVDCIPKRDPAAIVKDYIAAKNNPNLRFSLSLFVEHNFIIPASPTSNFKTTEKNLEAHITSLWKVLKRKNDTIVDGSSLLPLPHAYVVPGGRFREIYYWDSYFTMLGLKESGEYEMIEDMVKNFAYLIDRYGHVPNGNRTYYLSRSQPPFFSLMLELLAQIRGPQVFVQFQPALEKEYNYWMDRTAPTKHVVQMPDGSILNRYYDQLAIPRQESYVEDVQTASSLNGSKKDLAYRNLRSAAESGWDFSSRWMENDEDLSTIETISYVPVDLNCLLHHLELTLARSYEESGLKQKSALYEELAGKRKNAINKYCWSKTLNWYSDYDLDAKNTSDEITLAGMFPYFFKLADSSKAALSSKVLSTQLLGAGGLLTTTKNTGEQWDAPNGWAPLQWVSIVGLEQYGDTTLSKEIALRWFNLNKKVFVKTGRLMEKYNVMGTDLEAGGGEYPSQDGFGWTNGVLLALMKKYNLN
jgi:alpha,alpha-trehalase